MLSYAKFRMLHQIKKKNSQALFMVINLFETWCFQELIHPWNSVFTFVFVELCDAYITYAATEKPYRVNHRETVHKIWFRHVLDDVELKIFFVGQPWWPTFFMLHLPRNLGLHLFHTFYFVYSWVHCPICYS